MVDRPSETDPVPPFPALSAPWMRAGWLLGVPALLFVWGATMWVAAPRIAATLMRSGEPAIRASGEGVPEPWLHLEARGRDVLARGEAPTEYQRGAVLARVAAIPGLRRVIDRAGLIETASPFVWRAERATADRVDLTGSRPAEVGAAALSRDLAADLPPEFGLHDRARAALGAPPGFTAGAAFAVERLRTLSPGSTATLSDTVLSLKGEAASVAAYDAMRTALASPPQGFSLGTVEIQPPRIDDFRFAVVRLGGGVRLTGYAVSEAARERIRAGAAALAEGAGVEDGLQIAKGLPGEVDPDALDGVMLRAAALLQDGTVALERNRLSVTGGAIDAQAVGELANLVRTERPPGILEGAVTVTAVPVSPYRLHVRREGDSVTLSGHVPDQAARDAMLAALRPRFFREVVVDRTRVAGGAPPGLVAAVVAAVDPLSTLASADLAVSDRSLRLTGESLYAQSARSLEAGLPRTLPPGWSATVEVGVRGAEERFDADTCARLFAERLANQALRFPPGSAELRPAFYPLLDALAGTARTCPAQTIDVVGHVDAPGAAAAKPVPDPAVEAKPAAPEKPASPPGKPGAKAEAGPARPAAAPGATAGKDAKTARDAKGAPRPEAKPAEPSPSELARARAAAIVDYLQKAGVPPDRTGLPTGAAPQSERQGVGFAVR